MTRRQSYTGLSVPHGACDCHMHVFGPADRYRFATPRSYTPLEASLGEYRAMASRLGLERVVFVQPSAYGSDNSCMLDAMREFGPQARGIAVIDDDTPEEALQMMHAAGVRGVRFNAASVGLRDVDQVATSIRAVAERVAALRWHIQLYADLDVIAAVEPVLRGCQVSVVVDHMGNANGKDGIHQAGFSTLRDLLADGHIWAKLSGAERLSSGADLAEVAPVLRALVEANPDQVVWGTDWPHTGMHDQKARGDAPIIPFRPVDDRGLLAFLLDRIADHEMIERVLVSNPARLYEF